MVLPKTVLIQRAAARVDFIRGFVMDDPALQIEWTQYRGAMCANNECFTNTKFLKQEQIARLHFFPGKSVRRKHFFLGKNAQSLQ